MTLRRLHTFNMEASLWVALVFVATHTVLRVDSKEDVASQHHDSYNSTLSLRLPNNATLLIDRTSGNLTGLRGGDVDFLSNSSALRAPLVTLQLTRPSDTGGALNINSADYKNISVESQTVAGFQACRITFSDHADVYGKVPSAMAAIIIANTTSNKFHFSLQISNFGGAWAVQAATYPGMIQTPMIHIPTSPMSPIPGEIMLPLTEGFVIADPSGATLSASNGYYPRDTPVQFTARSAASNGMYLATEDSQGHVKRFRYQTQYRSFVRVEIQHFFGEQVGQDIAIPYDTVLTTYEGGTWRDAAAVYKAWAVNQPWAKAPLRNRTDIPKILLSGASGVIIGLQNASGYSGGPTFGPQLEKLPAYVAQMKARLHGTNMLLIPYGWENRGTWAGINYFPAVPSNDAWATASSALNTTGDALMLLVSGFWWVVKRHETSNGPNFDDSDELPSRNNMLIKAPPNGSTTWTDDFYNNGSQTWRGLSVSLCHGDDNATQTIADIVTQANKIGATVVSFDQEIGGGQSAPCYDHDHDHLPGYGSYMWEGMRRTMTLARASAQADGRTLGLSMEQTSELTIPFASTYWSRQFGVIDYPLFNAQGIGLFSYLYHEYVTATGAAVVQGQGVMGTLPDYLLRTTAMATTLTRGLIMVPFDHDVNSNYDQWHRNVSLAYTSYASAPKYFKEWLVFGKSEAPPVIFCRTLESWFYRGSKAAHVRHNISLPAVIVGSFTGGNDDWGNIIVSISPEIETASIVWTPDASTTEVVTLFDELRHVQQQWHPPFPTAFNITLKPYGVAVLATTMSNI
eukprot:m.36461 g.36461  ORF g.36461 m.36461 type:complete len:799 (-) comp17363_c0_seq1:42-2438(-)